MGSRCKGLIVDILALIDRAVGARCMCAYALNGKSATLKLRPPCSRYPVAVAVCRHRSHVSAMAQ